MDEVTMFLAGYALFDKSVAIGLHGWPEVTGSEYSGGHGSRVGVIPTHAFMQIFNYVLGLFGYDTFEEWLTVSSLV